MAGTPNLPLEMQLFAIIYIEKKVSNSEFLISFANPRNVKRFLTRRLRGALETACEPG